MHALIAGLLACGCVSLVDAPLWPPASDYINTAADCSQSSNAAGCKDTRATWTTNFDDAIGGKYQAQRNVSYCLSTGCDGAIRIDATLGCAWRQIAIETGHRQGDDSDASSLKQYCGRAYVDEVGERAADAEAQTLRQMLSVK